MDVEAAREYELPQHQLGSESDDDLGVEEDRVSQERRRSHDRGGSSGRRLV